MAFTVSDPIVQSLLTDMEVQRDTAMFDKATAQHEVNTLRARVVELETALAAAAQFQAGGNVVQLSEPKAA